MDGLCWLCRKSPGAVWLPHAYARGGRIWFCAECWGRSTTQKMLCGPLPGPGGVDAAGWPLRDGQEKCHGM